MLQLLRLVFCGSACLAGHNLCRAELIEYEIPKTGALLVLKGATTLREFYCALDTGSFETAVNQRSEDLYGKLIQKNSSDPRSTTKQSQLREGSPMKVAGYNLPPEPVTALPLDNIAKATGIKIEAIVGARQLKSTAIYIDNSKGIISINNPRQSSLVRTWNSSEIESKFDGVKIKLELIEKEKQFRVCTGLTEYLELDELTYSELVRSGHIVPWAGVKSTSTKTSGQTEHQRGIFQKGRFMQRELAGCPVEAGAENKIGLRWLHQYNYLIDFPNLKLFYQSRDFQHPIDPWVILGLTLSFDVDRHEVFISKLGVNSPLLQRGIKEGDRLVTFGLLKESEINFVTVEEEIQKFLDGKLTIEILKPGEAARLRYEISLKSN